MTALRAVGSRRFIAALICVLLAVGIVAGALALSLSGGNVGGWSGVSAQWHELGTILTHVPRNAAIFVAVTVICGLMFFPGDAILTLLTSDWRSRTERFVFAVAVGLGGWVPLIVIFGWAINLHRATTLIVLAIYIGLGIAIAVPWLVRWRPAKLALSPGLISWSVLLKAAAILVLAAILYFALLGALSPEVQFDSKWYHLGEAAHYAEAGRLYNIAKATHDPAMALNPYQELTYTAFYSIGGQQWSKAFAYLDLPLICVAIFTFGRCILGSWWIGMLAAIAFAVLPLATWSSATASNDLPIALYSLLALHMFIRWQAEPSRWSPLYVTAVLCGLLLGFKQFGFFTLGILALLVIVELVRHRQRSVREIAPRLAVCCGLVVAAALAWLVRSDAITGDPVFPLLSGIFHTPYWNKLANASAMAAYRPFSLVGSPWYFVKSLWDTLVHPVPFQSLTGPLFILGIPLSVLTLLFAKRVDGKWWILGVFSLLWWAGWVAGRFPTSRYLVAVAPVLILWFVYSVALALRNPRFGRLGLGAPAVFGIGMLLTSVLSTQLFISLMRQGPDEQGVVTYEYAYLYQHEPAFNVQLVYMPMVQYLNAHLQSTDVVLDGPSAGLQDCYLYLKPELYNGNGYGSPFTMGQWQLDGPEAPSRLAQLHIRYVVMPAASMSQFNSWPVSKVFHPAHQTPDGLVLLVRNGTRIN